MVLSRPKGNQIHPTILLGVPSAAPRGITLPTSIDKQRCREQLRASKMQIFHSRKRLQGGASQYTAPLGALNLQKRICTSHHQHKRSGRTGPISHIITHWDCRSTLSEPINLRQRYSIPGYGLPCPRTFDSSNRTIACERNCGG